MSSISIKFDADLYEKSNLYIPCEFCKKIKNPKFNYCNCPTKFHQITFSTNSYDPNAVINCVIERSISNPNSKRNIYKWMECKIPNETVSFDFTSTTNDSDFEIFQPHCNFLFELFNPSRWGTISIQEKIIQLQIKIKVKEITRDDALLQLKNIEKEFYEYIYNILISASKNVKLDRIWLQPAAKTIAQSLINITALPMLSNNNKKECAHVGIKRKTL